MSLIKANSVLYNGESKNNVIISKESYNRLQVPSGPTHDFTAAAERMLEVCRKSLVDVSVTPTTSVQGCGDLVLC